MSNNNVNLNIFCWWSKSFCGELVKNVTWLQCKTGHKSKHRNSSQVYLLMIYFSLVPSIVGSCFQMTSCQRWIPGRLLLLSSLQILTNMPVIHICRGCDKVLYLTMSPNTLHHYTRHHGQLFIVALCHIKEFHLLVMTQICVFEVGHRWFRYCLVARSVTGHYKNHCDFP